MVKKYFMNSFIFIKRSFKIKGLTLVELIVVIAIIGMLLLLALAISRGQILKGNDAKRKSDINRIKIAVEEYEKDHDCYPPAELVVCKPGTGLRPYLENIPCDPSTKASYLYNYEDNDCPTWYRFYSNLENTKDGSVVTGIGPNSAFNYVSGSTNAPTEDGSSGGPSGSGGSGGGAGLQSDFYGCRNSICVPIAWDASRPGPECDPNYQNSSCYGSCFPATECVSWK